MKKTSKKTEVKKTSAKTTKAKAKTVKAKKTTTKKVAAKPKAKPKAKAKTTKPKATTKKVAKPKVVKTKEETYVDSTDPEVLLGDRRHPRGWKAMTYEQKLDYIASRIIAEDRHGITSHKELKESGILSTSQYERRRNREVYSQAGDLDSVKVKPGVFTRTHVRDIRGVRNVPQQQPEETVDE